MSDLPPEALNDCCGPPEVPTEVHCIHCHNEYDSSLIVWREELRAGGSRGGFWCCPVPGCSGAGFLIDIFPTDPNWVDPRSGEKVFSFDDEDEEYDEDDLDVDDDDDDQIESDPQADGLQPVGGPDQDDDDDMEECSIPLDDLLPDSTDPDVMKLANYDFTFIQHQLEAELSRPDQPPPPPPSPEGSGPDSRPPRRPPPMLEDDVPF